MPELPEVETVAADLRPQLIGQRFIGVHVLWLRTVAEPDLPALEARLPGQQVVSVNRRGKYLLIELDSGEALIIHLGMTGRLNIEPDSSPAPMAPHVRAWFELANGVRLIFTDARKFGRLWLVDDPGRVVGKLGPEPLAWDFTPTMLADRLRGRRVAIKALLLDQAVVAGVGNIYADEALFLAGIHPLRAGASLTDAETGRLHEAIRQVLRAAIGERGTTLRDYRPPYGQEGAYQYHLRVYKQAGQPCPRCGTPILRIRVTQRSAHFCPRCQPASAPSG
jgi:formamidopyrimidine-DNA glycosylase